MQFFLGPATKRLDETRRPALALPHRRELPPPLQSPALPPAQPEYLSASPDDRRPTQPECLYPLLAPWLFAQSAFGNSYSVPKRKRVVYCRFPQVRSIEEEESARHYRFAYKEAPGTTNERVPLGPERAAAGEVIPLDRCTPGGAD